MVRLSVGQEVIEQVILTAFAEVWLAKAGHNGKIFINFLKKIELPLVFAMYGAMLAGVDGIVVGAGSPEGLPYLCSRLAQHEAVSIDIPMLYRESGESFQIEFNPKTVLGGNLSAAANHPTGILGHCIAGTARPSPSTESYRRTGWVHHRAPHRRRAQCGSTRSLAKR